MFLKSCYSMNRMASIIESFSNSRSNIFRLILAFNVLLMIIYLFTIAWNIAVSAFMRECSCMRPFQLEYLGCCMGVPSALYSSNYRHNFVDILSTGTILFCIYVLHLFLCDFDSSYCYLFFYYDQDVEEIMLIMTHFF